MMKWVHRLCCGAFLMSFLGTVALFAYTMRPRPDLATPSELYAVVQRHLAACRWADFPMAYHSASSSMQERFSLVQFEHKLRQDYQPVADAHHVEFGAVHHVRNSRHKVLVDVYFISRRGEATGWTYTLVFEDEDWKIDGAEPIPGWPAGQRLSGLRV
jgi:hypothetical protein